MRKYDDDNTTLNKEVIKEKSSTGAYILGTTVVIALVAILFTLFGGQNNQTPEVIPPGDINIELPETPEMETPELETPEINLPEVENSEMETPEVKAD